MIEIVGFVGQDGKPQPYDVIIWSDPTSPEPLVEQAHFSCRMAVDGLNAVVADKIALVEGLDLERRRFAGEYVLFEPDPVEAGRLGRVVDLARGDLHLFKLLASRVDSDAFGGWDSGIGRPMNLCYTGHARVPLLVAGVMRGAQLIATQRGLSEEAAAEFYRSHIKHTLLRPSGVVAYRDRLEHLLVEYI